MKHKFCWDFDFVEKFHVAFIPSRTESRRIQRNLDTTVYANPESSVQVMTLILGVHIP